MKKIKGEFIKDSNTTSGAKGRNDESTTMRIPVLAEELIAETRLVPRGAVRLRKGVRTEEQTLRVAAFHEEARVEHLSPEALGDVTTSDDPDVLIIPIYEEQVVVEKRMVLKEYVRVTKHRVTEEQVLHESVRRAYVEVVESDGVAANAPEVAGAGQAANG